MTPEIIHWIDACHHGEGWVDRDTISPDGSVCVSFGHVIHEDDQFVTIAAHVTGHQVAGVMSIPKGTIMYRTAFHLPVH